MKKVISIIAILIITIVLGAGCTKKADMYTEEEHIARITQRFQNKLYNMPGDDGIIVESFSVYPLYNENEELTMFLVEIEPYGFTFIDLRDEHYILLSCRSVSMYKISDFYGIKTWSPYIVDDTSNENKNYLINGNTERIYHKKSPYYVTENIDERKYLIETEGAQFICAVKKRWRVYKLNK